jgi:XTP/dITP diphosphohydrolase
MNKIIVLATHNQGKIAEFNLLLKDFSLTFVSQSDYGVADIEETGLSFIENALLKARHAAQCTGLPALADDSGLCVPALGDAPGIYSARYAGEHGNGPANVKKLLHEMRDISVEQRDAYFICVLAYVKSAEDQTPIICEARWQGRILEEAKGLNGFGYDPVFYVPEYDCSAAELSSDIKNKISHRARAVAALAQLCSNQPSLI